MVKVTADTTNGIQEVSELEGDNIGEKMFVACLDDLEDDEIIYAEISEACFIELNEKYGVAHL